MQRRTENQTPFMDPAEFGKSLTGLTVNLLVTDIGKAVIFAREVLQAQFRYHDPDIAIAVRGEVQWLIHSDHTYDKHPLLKHISGVSIRGAGIELRLHQGDPDLAALVAEKLGFTVFDGPRDQADHGLREVHIVDQDGYMWIVDRPL